MKPVFILFAAVACLLPSVAVSGAETRTPGEWVARLGADHLAEREEASAVLLELGSKAREPVRGALKSTDAEVQWRAEELWKTLRWLVVPGADTDVRALVAESENGKSNRVHWRDFVKKHGAESIRLVAEFYANKASGWEKARYAILEDANPDDVSQVIAHAGDDRASLLAPLEDLEPGKAARSSAVNLMKIEINLWNYEKAFDFGSDAWARLGDDEIRKQCAIAVDRGHLSDHVEEIARKDIAAETNAVRLCKKLAFYTGLFASTGRKDHIGALCDLAPALDTSKVQVTELKPLVSSLISAGMPERAVRFLSHAQSPLELYLRSIAESQMHDAAAAKADWDAVTAALDALKEERKSVIFSLGEVMRDWHDKRAALMWQKILDIAPPEPVYDANACFRLAEIAEDRHQYAHAADLYEQGMAFAGKSGGFVIVSGPGAKEGASGAETVQETIKRLRALAAGKKPDDEKEPLVDGAPAPPTPDAPVK